MYRPPLPLVFVALALACDGRSNTKTPPRLPETDADVAHAELAREDAGDSLGIADAGLDASTDAGFDAGDYGPDAGPSPCSSEMALVGKVCIDREEAHLVAPSEDGGFSVLPHNRRPPAGVRFEARSVQGVYPQGYINRVEAALACKNAGKRLCTMREWLRACQGRPSRTHPYGPKVVKNRCNIEKPHLLSLKFGAGSKNWKYQHFNDPTLLVEPGFLAKTGDYEDCVTREGVHDLEGNLHEWVSDTVDADFVAAFEAEDIERKTQPWKEGNGIFMGGFFSTSDQHGPGCTFTTIAHEPTYHDYSIGFRCCASALLPDPPKKKGKGK